MKTKYSISMVAAAVALMALAAPSTSFSQMKDMPAMEHREGNGRMMEMDHMDKMGDMMGMCMEHAEKLGLTDDQMKKLKPLHREMQKKHARFEADLKIGEIELMEIMEVKAFDLDKASAAVKNIADIKTAHDLDMLKAMKEMRATLTDEQFKEMKKMMPMKMDSKKHDKKKMMKK